MASCGGGPTTSTPPEKESEGTEKETSANDEEKTFKWKMNSSFPPTEDGMEWTARAITSEGFAEIIKEKTNGRIEIDIFYSNQLAGQTESLDALARGTFELQSGSPSAWLDKIPEGHFASLPYWTTGEDHALYMIRETEMGKLYEEALEEYGVKPLILWPASATGYMSTSPITTSEDLNGLVINATSNLTNDYYKHLGAGIATLPFTEQFEGLMRGTIDAIQYPYYTLKTYKLDEVVDYITVPPTLSTAFAMLAISKEAWDELPSDLQEIVMETSLELEKQSAEASKKLSQIGFDMAEESGIEFVKMTEESYNKHLELSKEMIWSKFENINERTKKMTEIITEENEKWNEKHPEDWEKFKEYFAE